MPLAAAAAIAVAMSSVGATNSGPSNRPVDPATARSANEALGHLQQDWFRGLVRYAAATVRPTRRLVRQERGGKVALTVTVGDIPPVPLAAYRNAAASLAGTDRSCHLPWTLLAGIGGIESDHARSGGSTRPGWNGIADPPILGPLLDGTGGFAAVPDTDGGRLDGNAQWDRAVGPMQFLPSSWLGSAADGDHDGVRNPQDMYDAALGAGIYLCRSGADLSTPRGLAAAVFTYNHSVDYVRAVLVLTARYAQTSPAALGIVPAPPTGPGAAAVALPAGSVARGETRPVARLSKLARPALSARASAAVTTLGAGNTAGTTSPSLVPSTAGSVTSQAPSPSPDPLSSSAPAPAVTSTTDAPTPVAPTPTATDTTASVCPSLSPTGSASPSPTPSPTGSPSPSLCPSP